MMNERVSERSVRHADGWSRLLRGLGWVALGFAATAGAEVVPLIHVESQSWSEPMALEAAFDDWHGEFLGGERQWTFNWAEVGVRGDNWSLAVLSRLDYDLRFSEDTAEFYYLTNAKRNLTPGKRYDLDLAISRFSGVGVRGAWFAEPLPTLRTAIGLSLFQARSLQEGELQGTATAVTGRDYQYNAKVDYWYDEDKLFDRPVEAPDGLGASLDLGVHWEPGDSLRVDARVVDLLGAIEWYDAPFTRATAASSDATDAQGNVRVTPILSGVEGTEGSHIQHLDPRVSVEAEALPAGYVNPVVSYRYISGQSLAGVGARTHWGQQRAGVHLWPEQEAVGVEYGIGRFSSSLSMDHLRTDEARALWVSLSYGADL